MTTESADGPCPKCGAARYKTHTLLRDIAVCEKYGHRQTIQYGGQA